MPSPFNFYQNGPTGTGIQYPQTPLDFFTGVYFPASLAAGQTVGFLWEGMGQKIVNQSLSISGTKIDSNNNLASIKLGFYGYSTPLIQQSGILLIKFTGGIPSDNIERSILNINLHGSGIRDNKESGNIKLIFSSGVYSNDNKDVSIVNCPLTSGVILNDNSDKTNLTLSFYGTFYPKTTPEYSTINLRISSVDYESTSFRTIVTSGTGVSILFRISDIYYDNAI